MRSRTSTGGIIYQNRGDVDGAIKDFDEAIRLKSDFAKAYFMRGILRESLFDRYGALKDFKEAVRLDPDYSSPYYFRTFGWPKNTTD